MKALLIGIDHYRSETGLSPLAGCVNDAKRVAAYLETCHGAEVCLLVSSAQESADVTGHHIKACLKRIVASLSPNDGFLFYFSGHGTRLASTEDKTIDEALVPIDGRDCLRDWELLRAVDDCLGRGARPVIVLDSCFSGGMNRQKVLVKGGSLAGTEVSIKSAHRSLEAGRNWQGLAKGAILMAACRDLEEAFQVEVPGFGWTGAFTHSLLTVLSHVTSGLSRQMLSLAVRTLVAELVRGQEPQMIGESDWLTSWESQQGFRALVLTHRGEHVLLSRGSLQGVCEGHQFHAADIVLTVTQAFPDSCLAKTAADMEMPPRWSTVELSHDQALMTIWRSPAMRGCEICQKCFEECGFVQETNSEDADLKWQHHGEPVWQTRWGPFARVQHHHLSQRLAYLAHFSRVWSMGVPDPDFLRLTAHDPCLSGTEPFQKNGILETGAFGSKTALGDGEWVCLSIGNPTGCIQYIAVYSSYQWGISRVIPNQFEQLTTMLLPGRSFHVPFKASLHHGWNECRERLLLWMSPHPFDSTGIALPEPDCRLGTYGAGDMLQGSCRAVSLEYQIRRCDVEV